VHSPDLNVVQSAEHAVLGHNWATAALGTRKIIATIGPWARGTDGQLRSLPSGADSPDAGVHTTMPIRVEAYTAGGIATGVVARHGHLREHLDAATELEIESSRWLPLDGSGERAADKLSLRVDDLLLVVADEPDGIPVHAQWHSIELDAGPYHVHGELPTMPGFDPGRALTRPTGEFVLLRDAKIELNDREDAGAASSSQILVNRYTVDRIAADLMLGFFFPGATMTITESSAGVHEAGATTVAVTATAAVAEVATASPAASPTDPPATTARD
jgi:hypothetical protein